VPAYAAAKGGLPQLTKACERMGFQRDQRERDAPGYMATENTTVLVTIRFAAAKFWRGFPRLVGDRWTSQARDILCSSASDYVHGQFLPWTELVGSLRKTRARITQERGFCRSVSGPSKWRCK